MRASNRKQLSLVWRVFLVALLLSIPIVALVALSGCRDIKQTTGLSSTAMDTAFGRMQHAAEKGDLSDVRKEIPKVLAERDKERDGYRKWIDDLNTKLWASQTDFKVLKSKTYNVIGEYWDATVGWTLTKGVLIGICIVVGGWIVEKKLGLFSLGMTVLRAMLPGKQPGE